MIPYIVVLVFLIVMILFQVYRMGEEGFDTVPATVSTSTQPSESEKKYKDMEERIVKSIVKELKDELFAKGVYIKRSDSLNTETITSDDMDNESDKSLEKSLINSIVKQMRSEVLPTYTNGAKTTSKSVKDIVNSDAGDFTSDKYDKELQDRLIKSVTKQLKDEMLLERAMTNLKDTNGPALPSPYAPTNMTQQGCEYKSGAPLNMDEYIRKDSIPCYGCTLPA